MNKERPKAKYKYLEVKPRKHTKIFDNKRDAWNYWEKRYKKYQNWDFLEKPNINPKDFYDSKIITLNHDGTPRKQTPTRNWTEKQKKSYRKSMKKYHAKLKKDLAERRELKYNVEEKLNNVLKEWGYEGETQIKYFKGEK